MSFLTLESLPDEILMLIFQYSGNTIDILRTFLGLNQRFNHILLDRRLHLLIDYLGLKPLNKYYDSNEFQQVTSQLLSVKTSIDEEKLSEILQSLYGYSVRQRYIESHEKFQLLRVKFESVHQNLSVEELREVDNEIQKEFSLLQVNPVTLEMVKRVEELVLTKGARLECDNYESTTYNLASFINDRILCHITQNNTESKLSMQLYFQIIRIFLISNPNLLDNRGYVGNGGCITDYFLLYTLFRLQYFYGAIPLISFVNLECFQTTLNLFFLTLHCRSTTNENRHRLQLETLLALRVNSIQPNNLQIQIIQLEIVKLVFQQINIESFSVDDFEYHILPAAKQLVKTQRLDILRYISRLVLFKDVFNTPIHIRECINIMTTNRTKRQFFPVIMKDPSISELFPQQHLLFILLDKKEHKFLKELLEISPHLINQLDEEGNDSLLYITLNVRGCRHRIIETLIKKGCDTKRMNSNGLTFRDALHLPRNRKLFETLIEHEIIE